MASPGSSYWWCLEHEFNRWPNLTYCTFEGVLLGHGGGVRSTEYHSSFLFFLFFLLLSLSFLLPVTQLSSGPASGSAFWNSVKLLTDSMLCILATDKQKTLKALCILHIFLRKRVKSLHLFDKYVKTSFFQHWCGERGGEWEREGVWIWTVPVLMSHPFKCHVHRMRARRRELVLFRVCVRGCVVFVHGCTLSLMYESSVHVCAHVGSF